MGIPIKYATTTPPNSLRKSNVAIGVNNVEYGPTNTTGWYNNINSLGNNIVIYKTQVTGDPDAFAPQSDQELYNFVIMQGGNSSNTTSVGAALTWIATQSDLLAVNNSLPNIITDGLILNLDASQVSSYPTTGTDWYDISGANNDGEMFNGLSFNSGGWMDFDGSDDYIWVPNNNGTMDDWNDQQTIIVWEYHDFTTGRRNIWNQAYGGFGTWTHEQGNSVNYYFGDSGANNAPYTSLNSSTTVRGKWNMLCVTRDLTTINWYQNGVLTNTRSNPYGSLTNTTAGVSIGTGYTGVRWQGKMSKILAYTKALTPSEVLQNYYQAPIVTDGLVFAVDAGNLVSYENGDTTTNSLVGSSTGTLNNGVGFDSANGGVFISDGTDDGILVPDDNTLDLSDFTLEAWVWWNQHKNYGSILCKGPGGTGQLFNYAFFFYSGNIVCGFGDGSNFYAASIPTPTINEWHHIVGTYDGSNLKFYLDGDLANSIPFVGTPYQNTTDLGLLHQPYPIDGKVGPLRIYNKALTADEVSQNFNAQRSRFI